ncbi:hypothetical protein ILUMI_18923 [Ignelater luminosus]|uniref:Uncharacterized protein n=1 Tax=Ignelater luminosus TaxID=2038154 RepID=A0A8K0G0E6_IGNLU|nr:hypothetical protein ILUMI_18923 [Ignelater luminosus]
MFKFVFLAALAFQVTRHILGHEAHELAHNVHEVAYHLQQIIFHNYNGQGQQTLVEIVRNLHDIVHAIQRALRQDPVEFQSQLRTQIENLVLEAGKLGTVAQQPQGSEDVNNELLVVLDDLLVAIQQFHVRSEIQFQNQQDIKTNVQTVVNQVSNTIQHVNVRDEHAVRKLVHYCHHLAHHLSDVIRKLERESRHYHGEVRDLINQVLNKLSEIRSTLEQAERDTTFDVLQHQLNACVHDISEQVQKLVVAVQSTKLDEHESRNLKNVVDSILSHTLAAERQLQRNIERLVEHNQEN